MQSVIDGAFSNYGVTGLNLEGVSRAFFLGLYNFE
jgi:hypothetical protein